MKTVNYLCSIFIGLSLLFGTHAVAEDAGAGGAGGAGGAAGGGAGGQGGNRQGNRGNFDPEQFRQRGLERIKENLGVNEDEWKALLPRVEAVQKLQTQARMGMFARRRPETGSNPPAAPATEGKPAPEKSDVEKKTAELQTLIENKEADPEAVKAKTQELRDAREKARQELKKAQDELRTGLTPRQEAQLVLAGLLE